MNCNFGFEIETLNKKLLTTLWCTASKNRVPTSVFQEDTCWEYLAWILFCLPAVEDHSVWSCILCGQGESCSEEVSHTFTYKCTTVIVSLSITRILVDAFGGFWSGDGGHIILCAFQRECGLWHHWPWHLIRALWKFVWCHWSPTVMAAFIPLQAHSYLVPFGVTGPWSHWFFLKIHF